jgi:hypothetical protein
MPLLKRKSSAGMKPFLVSPVSVQPFLLDKNIFLQRDAANAALTEISKWLGSLETSPPICRILDLSPPTWPSLAVKLASLFPDQLFEFSLVSTVSSAKRANVRQQFLPNLTLISVNDTPWNLDNFGSAGPYDIILFALQTSTASVAEISYFISAAFSLLAPKGLFLNHDFFRPEATPFIGRPDYSFDTATESMRLVPEEKFESIVMLEMAEPNLTAKKPGDWRKAYISDVSIHLRARGADEATVFQVVRDFQRQEFPLTRTETLSALAQFGFKPRLIAYDDSEHPLQDYYSLVASRRD